MPFRASALVRTVDPCDRTFGGLASDRQRDRRSACRMRPECAAPSHGGSHGETGWLPSRNSTFGRKVLEHLTDNLAPLAKLRRTGTQSNANGQERGCNTAGSPDGPLVLRTRNQTVEWEESFPRLGWTDAGRHGLEAWSRTCGDAPVSGIECMGRPCDRGLRKLRTTAKTSVRDLTSRKACHKATAHRSKPAESPRGKAASRHDNHLGGACACDRVDCAEWPERATESICGLQAHRPLPRSTLAKGQDSGRLGRGCRCPPTVAADRTAFRNVEL